MSSVVVNLFTDHFVTPKMISTKTKEFKCADDAQVYADGIVQTLSELHLDESTTVEWDEDLCIIHITKDVFYVIVLNK